MKKILYTTIILLAFTACKKTSAPIETPEPTESITGKIKTQEVLYSGYTYPERMIYLYNEKGKLKQLSDFTTNNGTDFDSAGSFLFITANKELSYIKNSGGYSKNNYFLNEQWLVYKGTSPGSAGTLTHDFTYNSNRQLAEMKVVQPVNGGGTANITYKWYYTGDRCDSFTYNSIYNTSYNRFTVSYEYEQSIIGTGLDYNPLLDPWIKSEYFGAARIKYAPKKITVKQVQGTGNSTPYIGIYSNLFQHELNSSGKIITTKVFDSANNTPDPDQTYTFTYY